MINKTEVKCQHDWRVNPYVILTSNPTCQQIVCSKCGDKRSRLIESPRSSKDPQDWPKAW